MAQSEIGAQMYTLRDFTKTPSDFARTIRKVKKIGYDAVQLSAHGPIDPKELKKIVDGEGMVVAATHVGLERLKKEIDDVIDEHRLWGCKHIAIGGVPMEYHNLEGYKKFAREGAEIARKLAKAGLTFSYHNHQLEFEKHNGRRGIEILIEESDPEAFFFEVDTYWVQYGGGDPVFWIRKMKNRMPLVHFKDMAISKGAQVMAEVGEGNLNWAEIIKACEEAGVQWYLVEQDTCQRDPFESLAMSLRNLKQFFLE